MFNRLSLLVVAVIVSLAAIFLVRYQMTQQEREAAPSAAPAIKTASVLVATQPLFFGSKIERQHVKLVEWPAENLPAGAFQSMDAFFGEEKSRTSLRGFEVNEIILASKVSGPGGRLSVSGLIESGKRAVAIRVNDVVGVGGFVLPGDRVDVMLTRELDSGKGNDRDNIVTDVLLQNIRVLGVDQDANEAREQPVVARTFTVEVDMREGQKLVLAQRVGQLSIALRDLENQEPATVTRVAVADLLRNGQAPVQYASAKKSAPRVTRTSHKASVQVYREFRGTKYSVPRQGRSRLAGDPVPLAQATPQQNTPAEDAAVPTVPSRKYEPDGPGMIDN